MTSEVARGLESKKYIAANEGNVFILYNTGESVYLKVDKDCLLMSTTLKWDKASVRKFPDTDTMFLEFIA